MSKLFMRDTPLEGLERMMMDTSRTPAACCTSPRRKKPQKKPVCDRPRLQKRKSKGGAV